MGTCQICRLETSRSISGFMLNVTLQETSTHKFKLRKIYVHLNCKYLRSDPWVFYLLSL